MYEFQQTQSCNHHHNQNIEYAPLHQIFLLFFSDKTSPPSPATGSQWSDFVLIVLPFFPVAEWNLAICSLVPLSFTAMLLRVIHIVACISNSSLFSFFQLFIIKCFQYKFKRIIKWIPINVPPSSIIVCILLYFKVTSTIGMYLLNHLKVSKKWTTVNY